MIETAELGMRHHTRLKAARLLGGYVASGLLSEDQAYGALAHALVGHTDDRERALKTVVDGLKYGQAHPITLEAWKPTGRPGRRNVVLLSRSGHPTIHGMGYPHCPSDPIWAIEG
jgi:hypothetical protein